MKVHVIVTIEEEWMGSEVQNYVLGAISKGALAALIAFPHHDDPPGDWYHYYYLVCANNDVAKKATALGWELDNHNPSTHTYENLPCLHVTQSTHLGGRDVVRRPNEHSPEFAVGFAQTQIDPANGFALELERIL